MSKKENSEKEIGCVQASRRSSRKGLDRLDDGNEMLWGWSLHETRSKGWYGLNVARPLLQNAVLTRWNDVCRYVFEAERKKFILPNVAYVTICDASDWCGSYFAYSEPWKKERNIKKIRGWDILVFYSPKHSSLCRRRYCTTHQFAMCAYSWFERAGGAEVHSWCLLLLRGKRPEYTFLGPPHSYRFVYAIKLCARELFVGMGKVGELVEYNFGCIGSVSLDPR